MLVRKTAVGTKYCTPEVDASEIIVDVGGTSQWTFSVIFQCLVTCSIGYVHWLRWRGG